MLVIEVVFVFPSRALAKLFLFLYLFSLFYFLLGGHNQGPFVYTGKWRLTYIPEPSHLQNPVLVMTPARLSPAFFSLPLTTLSGAPSFFPTELLPGLFHFWFLLSLFINTSLFVLVTPHFTFLPFHSLFFPFYFTCLLFFSFFYLVIFFTNDTNLSFISTSFLLVFLYCFSFIYLYFSLPNFLSAINSLICFIQSLPPHHLPPQHPSPSR